MVPVEKPASIANFRHEDQEHRVEIAKDARPGTGGFSNWADWFDHNLTGLYSMRATPDKNVFTFSNSRDAVLFKLWHG